ncbi:hypothetical protein H7H51_12770, partial [Mycolicibacterium farcinogenes]|nr:hypothetical protein [Mycolicibacterium farcinogenes]
MSAWGKRWQAGHRPAGRPVRSATLVVAALPNGAATLAIWNPYVAERLLQGHWSLLIGYGALPWVAVCVLRLRTD